MTATDFPDSGIPDELTTQDRRTHTRGAAGTPKRRLDDTLFNRLRWPAFLVLWFLGGLAVFLYLIDAISG